MSRWCSSRVNSVASSFPSEVDLRTIEADQVDAVNKT